MRTIFLGSGPIATACVRKFLQVQAVQEKRHLVGLVADEKLRTGVVASCRDLGLPVPLMLDASARNDDGIAAMIAASGADMLISVQYGWILPEKVLVQVGGRAVNLHNAKLPDYRGHNALSHEILNQESTHVVTLHWIAPVVDRGFRCLEVGVPILPTDTAQSLYQKALPAAVGLFSEFVEQYEELMGRPRVPIEGEGRWYGKYAIGALKQISPEADMETIARTARAFWFPPHEPAYILRDEKRYYIVPQWPVTT